jgi:hypothetical protein
VGFSWTVFFFFFFLTYRAEVPTMEVWCYSHVKSWPSHSCSQIQDMFVQSWNWIFHEDFLIVLVTSQLSKSLNWYATRITGCLFYLKKNWGLFILN